MLTLITPPTTKQEPVTVTELAQNLILTTGAEEYTGWDSEQLQQHIRAARADAEKYTGRYFSEQVVQLVLSDFTQLGRLHQDTQAIVKINYYDTDNQPQTYPDENYYLAAQHIMLNPEYDFPATFKRPDAVKIDLQVGQNIEQLPDVKQAILLIASHWHENHEASSPLTVKVVPLSYQYLLDSHKHYVLG